MTNFFLNNDNDINQLHLKEGNAIKSDDKFLKKYDKNNNSIWDTEEITQFMSDLDDADINADGKIDKDESISWYAKITGLDIGHIKSTFKTDESNEVYQSLGNIMKENAEETAILRVGQMAQEGLNVYNAALGGAVSKSYNSIKELFNTEYAGDKVYRQLAKNQVSAWLLEKAHSSSGLTAKEYIKEKIDLLKALLGADKLSAAEQKNIEQSIQEMDLAQVDDYILSLASAENNEYSALQKNIRKKLATENALNNNKDSVGRTRIKLNTIKAFLQSGKAEEKLSFDKIFELEMGVPFNQVNSIQKYEKQYMETNALIAAHNKVVEINNDLLKNIAAMDGYNKNGNTTGLANERDTLYKNLSNSILQALRKFYGNDEEKINETLAIYNAKLENDMITFCAQGINDYAIVDMAKKIQENINNNLTKLMNGKTLEDYQSDLQGAYQMAYGLKNSVDLASKFQESQQEGVGYAKIGASTAGIALAVLSNGTLLPIIGIAIGAFGSGIVSGIEATTKDGGMSKDEAKEIAKELATSGILTVTGIKEGQIAAQIGKTLLKSCPKFVQYLGEYGSMAVMGALTDYAVMGEISLTQESISNLINIATGVIAHKKMAKMQERKTGKPADPQSSHNTKPYSEMNEEELLAEYKRLNDEFSEGKLDNQESIDKISQIQKELDAKGLCIENGKLTTKKNNGVEVGNNMHLSNYVQEGKMVKYAEYELNIDRLPVIELPGGEVLDLNNKNYIKQIYSLSEGQRITIGREGDILTNQNNKYASRKHLIIYKENGRLKIQDISTSGTEIKRTPRSKEIGDLQSGNMNSNQSYILDENNLPKLKLANQVEINLKNYKNQINLLQEGQSLTIGREGKIKINNQYVSATHIIIYRSNGQLKIKDISSNGTVAKCKTNIFESIKNKFSKTPQEQVLLPHEAKILEQFKDIPEVRAVMNNPAEAKKLVVKINKVINNPKFVSAEIRRVLTSGSTISNGIVVKNCSISKDIINDIVKIAQNGDYITKFRSKEQALQKTPVGDVAKVDGKLYVNNGYAMEPINMSEKTFRELFPPVKRFATHQGKVGTCYLVSTLENLYTSPNGRVEIYRLIGEDNNGIYTKTANGNGQKTYFERWDSKHKHIMDETGLAIIEQGYCKNTVRSAQIFNPRETIIMQANSGGWSWEALKGLLGKTPYVSRNKQDFANIIRQNANNKNMIINCGTGGSNGLSDRNALNQQYDIWAHHEYSIKGYDQVSDCVLIANPWHSEAIIKIPLNEFLQYFNEISCIQL